MEEILNLEYHFRRMTLKALNRTQTVAEAARQLGISERLLFAWKAKWGIIYDRTMNQFILKGINDEVHEPESRKV